MSARRAPERWTHSLPASDPLRAALSEARADLPSRDRLDRVFGGLIGAGGPGAEGQGRDDQSSDDQGRDDTDGGDADRGGEGVDPTGPALPGPGDRAPGAPLVAAAKAASPSGLAKLVAVAALGAASITTAIWVSSPEPRASTPEPAPRSAMPTGVPTAEATAAPPPPIAAPTTTARPAAAPSAEIDDGTIETSLLREAQASLASAPHRSLELVQEAERRFPRGALAQERQVIGIQALLSLGRRDEAVARTRALLSANPTTAHRPRLEQLMPELAD